MKLRTLLCCLLLFLVGSKSPQSLAAQEEEQASTSRAWIDEARLNNAASEPGNWLAHGRTYEEQRFSPLDQINRDTVARLGLAWMYDMGTTRGLEATPIIVDGLMFLTGAWSKVYAFDAKTGALIWSYDPKVPRSWGQRARGRPRWSDCCCGSSRQPRAECWSTGWT